jgi:O-antigen/teichoic acid export membrane protein
LYSPEWTRIPIHEAELMVNPIQAFPPERVGTDFRRQDVSILAGGASISLAGKILGRSLSFMGDIAAARILGPGSFGLYAIGWTVLRMLSLISPLGLDKGVIYFSAPFWWKDPASPRKIIHRTQALAFGSGLIFGAVLYLAAPFLAQRVFQKQGLSYIFRWYALAFPLVSILVVSSAATRITKRMKYSATIEDVAQPAVGLLFLVLFYLIGLRLEGVLASDVLSFAIPAILAVWVVRRLFPGSRGASAGSDKTNRELLSFSIPASLAGVLAPFLIWVDRLIVGHFRTPVETGIYQAVSQTSTVFAIILSAFAAIFIPLIADLYHKKEFGRLEELFRVSTKWGFYLSLPIFIMLVVFPREVLAYVFDSRYVSGWGPLIVLSIGQLVNVGTGAVGPALVMTGHQKRWFILTGTALALNIGLNWCLVPSYGLMGAAVSTAISLSGMFLFGVVQVRSVLRIWPYDRRYLKGLAGAGLAILLLALYRSLVPVHSLLGVILASAVTGTIFLGAILVLGLDREDKEFIRSGLVRWRQMREGSLEQNGRQED